MEIRPTEGGDSHEIGKVSAVPKRNRKSSLGRVVRKIPAPEKSLLEGPKWAKMTPIKHSI